MHYRIFHNPSAHFMRPFQDGDVVIAGYEGDIDTGEPGGDLTYELAVCEAIYSKHNRDDRPDGQDAPSLSIGDVVILHGTAAYSVDVAGFVEADFIQVGRVDPGPYRRVIEGVMRGVLATEQAQAVRPTDKNLP